MKTLSSRFFIILALISSLGLRTGHAPSRSGIEKSRALSVTGCLVKGDEPKEVWLAQKDGTIYGLASSKIDLNANLGHRVVVSGYLLSEGNKEGRGEAQKQTKTGKHKIADLRVLALKMISGTCR
jgi:hypothetical protein